MVAVCLAMRCPPLKDEKSEKIESPFAQALPVFFLEGLFRFLIGAI